MQPLRDALRSAVREAIVAQRAFAEAEEITARQQIEAAGCDVIELSDAERQAFQDKVKPVYAEARRQFGDAMIDSLGVK